MYVLRQAQSVFFVLLISIPAAAQTLRPAQSSPSGFQGIVKIICDPDTGCPSPTPRPTPIPTPTPTPAPPDLTFDANAYENIYPDIKNVYGNNLAGATSHYQLFGLPAGRRGWIIFDPVFYLQHNPDLQAAFGPTGYQAAANHFINTGLPVEGRQGSDEFDVKYYLANNPDLLAAFGSTGYVAAAQHFLSQGLIHEGRQGSATFGVKIYINNYPDVKAAYTSVMGQYSEPMFHWLRRGKGFGRIANVALPVVSADCTASVPPNIPGTNTPFTRIYIGLLGFDGTGLTPDSPRDGRMFDAILRPYSGDPSGGIPAKDGLIVCILAGNYQTDGAYNYVINIPHNSEVVQNRGFALGPHWHVHGYGTGQTTITLNSFYVPPPGGEPASTKGGLLSGSNIVFATGDDNNPGVEISDLTIDCNYPTLKAPTLNQMPQTPLSLLAIHLRDNVGGHYIHRVNVVNVANEAPFLEAFPVQIASVLYNKHQDQHANPPDPPSTNNTIEFVTMSQWTGHVCTAMTMVYATGTMQFNVVNGYQIAYGGWEMPFIAGTGGAPNQFAYIHDNFAINDEYGMNIDSEFNDFVNIQFNTIVNPSLYGIVIGGTTRFDNFVFLYNEIDFPGAFGVIFQGNVTNSVLARTDVIGQSSGPVALNVKNSGNIDNSFQSNQLSGFFSISFSNGSLTSQNCEFGNWDQNGNQRSDFPNNTSTPCRPGL
jgi:hypothetical protein